MSGTSGSGDGNGLTYGKANAAVEQTDPAALAPYLFWLMFRNVASDGLVFNDPVHPGTVSAPGCVLASPSWENTATQVTQDYVYHWTRDAAIVALELSAAYTANMLPTNQPLIDYVTFSATCQAAPGDFDRASFYINGAQRPWTDQTDGPALQTVALLAMYRQLDAPTQAIATGLINANLAFLSTAYQGQTYNLWEEEYGYSFFARSAQLRCFQAVAANVVGIAVPSWLPTALTWLASALDGHWNGQYYQSMLPVPTDPTTSPTTPTSTSSRRRSTGPSRSPTPGCWRPRRCCGPSGPTPRRRTSTRSTAPTRPRASARCSAATRATSTTATPTPWSATTPGRSPPPTSPSSTTGSQSKSFHPERSRPTLSPPPSSPRSG